MSKIAVFTDASRVMLDDGAFSSAYGWAAIDFNNHENSFMAPHVAPMEDYSNSTVHSEVLAVYGAAHFYKDFEEVHIFTDSLYVVTQVLKSRSTNDYRKRPVRVFPEKLKEIAEMGNVHLHHVPAHKSYFYNELVDKMVGFVARGELSLQEAEQWARDTCRGGTLEVKIGKKASCEPKYVRRRHERNGEILREATP